MLLIVFVSFTLHLLCAMLVLQTAGITMACCIAQFVFWPALIKKADEKFIADCVERDLRENYGTYK